MKHKTKLLMLTLTFLLGSIIAFAQAMPPTGTYEAMVKIPNRGEEKVTLELKNDGGKITGRVTHGPKTADSTEAKLENDTLTLNFGEGHIIVAKVNGDKLVGEATDGKEKIPVEFKKVTPAAAAAPATPSAAAPAAPATPSAAAPFKLDGQWDGVADANGQPFPFALTLKVEGETVTGTSSSQLGNAVVKSGMWKDGKLSFQLEGQDGVITLSGTVIDGKLSGEFDYAGQLSGRWVAVKKN